MGKTYKTSETLTLKLNPLQEEEQFYFKRHFALGL